MVPMKALVGFSDRALITDRNPSGSCAPTVPFDAPSAEIADRLEAEGLAERAKAPASAKKS